MQWSDLRDKIRDFLGDTETPTRFSDGELMQYANWGLLEIATVKGVATSVNYDSGNKEYTLPSDIIHVDYLMMGDSILEELILKPGQTIYEYDVPKYYIEGSTLKLTTNATDDLVLHYTAYYPEIENDNDDPGLPKWAEQALLLYVACEAMKKTSGQEAMLNRWNTKVDSGTPIQNPIIPYWMRLRVEFERILYSHLPEQYTIYRPGAL